MIIVYHTSSLINADSCILIAFSFCLSNRIPDRADSFYTLIPSLQLGVTLGKSSPVILSATLVVFDDIACDWLVIKNCASLTSARLVKPESSNRAG